MKGFLVAGGSVPGTDHTLPGQPGWKNNQDAFDFYSTEDLTIAVVCDGCGSSEYSEVGSRLGAQMVVKQFKWMLGFVQDFNKENVGRVLAGIQRTLVGDLWSLALSVSRTQTELTVMSHFFFTIVGVVVTKQTTLVFSFGDGVYAINGEVKTIPPAGGNAPPYLGQCLVPGCMPEKYLHFTVQALLPTQEVTSVLIGTDGVNELASVADEMLPGKHIPVGPLSQFWTDDKYVENPDCIRRHLALVNLETIDQSGERPRIKKGLLYDDTTLMVVRKMEGA